jgi:DNA-binding SARP family transcriptional activator/ABC-type transport system substrate-binding protein
MESSSTLRVFLAGRDVEADGPVIDAASFPGRQGRLLFAYLVAEQGRPVPRDELADALWGEALPATWSKALGVLASKLRGELSSHGVDGASALTSAFGCYRLDLPEGSWVDIVAAARAAREAELALAAGELDAAAAAASLAVSLTRQPFLPGEDGSWVEQKRGELGEVRRRALSALADARLRSGDAGEAVRWAKQSIALEPFRESGYRRLMAAHAAAGNRAEALRVYEQCRRLLADELGAFPSPETEAIYRELLATPPARREPTADAPTPSDTRPRSAPPGARRSQRRGALVVAALATAVGVAAALVALTRGGSDGAQAAPVTGNAVAIVDASSGRLVGSVPLDSAPGAITYGAGSLWVSLPDARVVDRLAPASRKVLASVPLERPAQSLAASSRSVWAVGSTINDTTLTLERIDPTFDSATRVRRLPLLDWGETGSLAATRDTVIVAPQSGPLITLDARNGQTLSKVNPTVSPTAVAHGFGSTWLVYREANLVVRIDATGGSTTIPVDNAPTAITVGRRDVWVTDSLDGTVKPISPATNSPITTIRVGSEPSAIAEADGSVWVGNAGDGTLTRIDERTLKPIARVVIGGSPQALVVADGEVWVSVLPPLPSQPSGGTLVVSEPHEIWLFDPAAADTFDGAPIESAICSSLLRYPDEPAPAGLRAVPDAARTLPSVSDDGRTYSFVIRRGLRFSPPSNQSVTAQTFKHTIERSFSPSIETGPPAQYAIGDVIVGTAAYIAGKARHIAGVTAHGDRLTIQLVHPMRNFLELFTLTSAFCAVPSDMPPTIVVPPFPSAGPYYIAAALPGRSLTLLRNPGYHGNRQRRPRRILVLRGPQLSGTAGLQQIREVEAGRIDWAIGAVTADQDARLERLYGAHSPAARHGRPQYVVTPMPDVDEVNLNTTRPLFASERMRRAVNYAVDRKALAAHGGMWFAHASVAQMYLPPGVPGYRDEHIYPLTPDLTTARRLAGRGRHTAVIYCWQGAGGPQAARILAHDLAAIHIQAQVHCWPGNQFWSRILTPGAPWDLAVDGATQNADPGDYLDAYVGNNAFNVGSFHDRRVDALLRAAARTSGPARAFAYAHVDHVLVRDVAPEIAYANESEHDLFSARVGCQVIAPLGGVDLGSLCIRTSRDGVDTTHIHS